MAAYHDVDEFYLDDAEKRTYTQSPLDVFELGAPSRKKVVSVKIEERLLEEIDRAWRELGYGSRSEFIREAVIYYMLVRRAMNATNLCLCSCDESPNAKRVEDVLAEYAVGGASQEVGEYDILEANVQHVQHKNPQP